MTWSDFWRLFDFISCEIVLTNGDAMEQINTLDCHVIFYFAYLFS